jgi:TrmH family RNA methyltransferase
VVASDKDIRIVLVRPRNPLNIGAAARAMLNFGFEDLVLVSPHEPVWEESRSAPGAERLLHDARVVTDLPAAIDDRTLVIGTSSLSRRRVSQPVLSLEQLSRPWKKRRKADRVAVVFGSEKTGLSKKDLSLAHWIVRIPAVLNCPSMNLGQAVAVCCYELRRLVGFQDSPAGETAPPAAAGEVERLVNEIEKRLSGTPEPASGPEGTRKERLRRMLLRWPITSQDVVLALGILRDISWQLSRKP